MQHLLMHHARTTPPRQARAVTRNKQRKSQWPPRCGKGKGTLTQPHPLAWMDLLLGAYGDDSSSSSDAEEAATLPSGASLRLPTKRGRDDKDGNEEEDGDEDGTQGRTKKAVVVRLPPPPADLFGEEDENRGGEDRVGHLGRIRTFPHIEGNYPTFVYIPVYINAVEGLADCAQAQLDQFRAWLPGRKVYPITETREEETGPRSIADTQTMRKPLELIYHVSISRTVGVRQHQIEPLIELLRASLTQEESFEASFGASELFTNDERTRSFFSLSIVEGKARICQLIAKVDEVFKQFRLPTYYEDPRPHMTIGWTLGDVMTNKGDGEEQGSRNAIPGTLRAGLPYPLSSDGQFRFRVRNVQCTPGRNIYNFPLLRAHDAP